MSAASERAFARRVLDTLALADGKREVFGRPITLTDEQIVRLIRDDAEALGLS